MCARVGQKLELERNVHYGPGSSTKKGTVDVHRGGESLASILINRHLLFIAI